MVLPLQSHCQNTLKSDRVVIEIDSNGDTLVVMSLGDAKILLEDVLMCEYSDSIIKEYEVKDVLNEKNIKIYKSLLDKLNTNNLNLLDMNSNLRQIIKNKEEVIGFKDEEIDYYKKEVRKQKRLKRLGFLTSTVLPIIIVIILI